MIIVIDTVRHSGEHMHLNAEILKTITQNNEKVKFITSLEYWKSFSPELRSKIIFEEHPRLLSGLIGTLKTIHLTIKLILFCKDFEKIIFLSSIAYNTFFVALLSKTNLFSSRVFVFLHEVSYIDSRKFSQRLAGFFLVLSFNIGLQKGSKFIVTGEYILQGLKERIGSELNSITFIEHPTSSIEIELHALEDFLPLKISSIGVQNNEKHSHLLEYLAKCNRALIKEKILSFSTMGRMDYSHDPESAIEHNGLKYKDYLIPRNDYEKFILDKHYIALFLGNEYDLKTSGVLFDSINFQKPILALENKLTKYYFKKFGDIGHLFGDIEEMNEGLKEISGSFDVERYNIQVSNLLEAKHSTNPGIFKKNLLKIFNHRY